MASWSDIPAQCGMKLIHSMSDYENLEYQIAYLKGFFGNDYINNPQKAMCIMTDQQAREVSVWGAIKAVAFKSEARRNPNSANYVVTYIIYPEHILQLEERLHGATLQSKLKFFCDRVAKEYFIKHPVK